MAPSLDLPPDEFCLGTKPSQAVNSLPFLNTEILPAVATAALAVTGLTPQSVNKATFDALSCLLHALMH